MKFFEDTIKQVSKRNQIVCGDTCLCERTPESTEFVLCDGIGSGIYANIAAITCANRLIEFFRTGVSLRSACEMVADSMHRARKEDIPFSAFSVARILNDGQFTVYTFEAPAPLCVKDGAAQALKQRFYTADLEVIGESSGTLGVGDSLLLCSDGVTQAGMGNGYAWGIGSEGIADFLTHKLAHRNRVHELLDDVVTMSARISGGAFVDDTTVALLHCREAAQLTILSGPPANRANDRVIARRFVGSPGVRVVCGSTTADIVSRELHRAVTFVNGGTSFSSPPEYTMEGADMVTEGAAVLNQVFNILDENPDGFEENTPAQRLCSLFHAADVVTFLVGNAVNDAHTALLFKQLGIRPRQATIGLIADQLRKMGKLVVEEFY